MKKLKSMLLTGVLSSLAFATQSSQADEGLYVTYQKNNSDWTISAISPNMPSVVRPGIEEVVHYSKEGLSPAFQAPTPSQTNGFLTYSCVSPTSNDTYSACRSHFAKKLDDLGIESSEDPKLKTYDTDFIYKVFNNTSTQDKIDEFYNVQSAYYDLVQFQELLWLETLETLVTEWNKYETSKKTLKPSITVDDRTGLFTDASISELPDVMAFNDTYQYPLRPEFLKPESLLKHNPETNYKVHGSKGSISRARKVLRGQAQSFLDSKLAQQRQYTRNYYLKSRSLSHNGWEMTIKLPDTASRISSNKTVPVNVKIIGKKITNVTPYMEINDRALKATLNNGNLVFNNQTLKPLKVNRIETASKLFTGSYSKEISIDSKGAFGINVFDEDLFPKNSYSTLNKDELLTTYIPLTLKIEYSMDGQTFYLYEEVKQNVSQIFRFDSKSSKNQS